MDLKVSESTEESVPVEGGRCSTTSTSTCPDILSDREFGVEQEDQESVVEIRFRQESRADPREQAQDEEAQEE